MKPIAIPIVTTPRLILRKLEERDIPDYFERIGSSPNVTRFMLWEPHKDISESEASIRKALARYAEGSCCRWGIALREDDRIIGVIELLRFNEADSSCSFAYMLGEDYWGKGYGTEALRAAFGYAFGVLKIDTITADHMADNPASGAVMRKAGMVYVRTIPRKYEKKGIWHDAAEYRITREQWSKNGGSF